MLLWNAIEGELFASLKRKTHGNERRYCGQISETKTAITKHVQIFCIDEDDDAARSGEFSKLSARKGGVTVVWRQICRNPQNLDLQGRANGGWLPSLNQRDGRSEIS